MFFYSSQCLIFVKTIHYLIMIAKTKDILVDVARKLFAEKGCFCFQKCNFYHSEVQPYHSEVQLYYGNNRATFCVAN